jgi:hypothetical protein
MVTQRENDSSNKTDHINEVEGGEDKGIEGEGVGRVVAETSADKVCTVCLYMYVFLLLVIVVLLVVIQYIQ